MAFLAVGKTRTPSCSLGFLEACECSGWHNEPRHAVQPSAPSAPPKRAPLALPVHQNPDISQEDAIKASVKKASSFQRPDSAAMRAALQSAGTSVQILP